MFSAGILIISAYSLFQETSAPPTRFQMLSYVSLSVWVQNWNAARPTESGPSVVFLLFAVFSIKARNSQIILHALV